MKHDITNMTDIRLLVNSFYQKIREDESIGSFFNDKINDWESHLEKMHSFWQTLLLDEFTYKGKPFPLHAPMPLSRKHFDQWLILWISTVDEFFAGKTADEAKERGGKMAI